MTISSILQNISHHYLPLEEACLAELEQYATIQSIDKEEILVREGQYTNKIYFIAKGSLRAYYLKDGRDISDWFAFENNFISNLYSFFLEQASEHYIAALEPSILLVLSKEKVDELSDKYRSFDRLGKLIITQTMLQLQQRIVALQFMTAHQKYQNLLAVRPDITQRVPLTHIASYLGITLETLSRIRKPKH